MLVGEAGFLELLLPLLLLLLAEDKVLHPLEKLAKTILCPILARSAATPWARASRDALGCLAECVGDFGFRANIEKTLPVVCSSRELVVEMVEMVEKWLHNRSTRGRKMPALFFFRLFIHLCTTRSALSRTFQRPSCQSA